MAFAAAVKPAAAARGRPISAGQRGGGDRPKNQPDQRFWRPIAPVLRLLRQQNSYLPPVNSAALESGLGMELALNLVWLLAAATLVCLWLIQQRSEDGRRHFQLVAIAALILILFPVISVTDDLQTPQNLAETDTSLRRDHEGVQPHSIFPSGDALPEMVFNLFPLNTGSVVAIFALPAPVAHSPFFADHPNRPPPSA